MYLPTTTENVITHAQENPSTHLIFFYHGSYSDISCHDDHCLWIQHTWAFSGSCMPLWRTWLHMTRLWLHTHGLLRRALFKLNLATWETCILAHLCDVKKMLICWWHPCIRIWLLPIYLKLHITKWVAKIAGQTEISNAGIKRPLMGPKGYNEIGCTGRVTTTEDSQWIS